MKERWLGATGLKVRAVVAEDEIELPEGTLDVIDLSDKATMRVAFEEGRPIVVHASSAEEVRDALAHPEVSCVLVPADRRDLLELDLRALTYG